MTWLLGGLAVALTLAGNIWAVRAVLAGNACPVPVSWAGWAILMLEGGGGTWAGSPASAAYVLTAAAGCVAVAILAARIPPERRDPPVRVRGVRLDWICAPAAAGFLVLLLAASAPVWAVALTIAADGVLFIPTYGHGWAAPREESPVPYALFALGAVAALAAVAAGPHRSGAVLALAVAYPLYLLAADGGMAAMVTTRRLARGWVAPVAAVVLTAGAAAVAIAGGALSFSQPWAPPAATAQIGGVASLPPLVHQEPSAAPPKPPAPGATLQPPQAVSSPESSHPASSPSAASPSATSQPASSPTATTPSPRPTLPSPTPTPSPTPSPAPSPSPSPSPTPSPTPTPTPTPSDPPPPADPPPWSCHHRHHRHCPPGGITLLP